jgi:hypothetical protein
VRSMRWTDWLARLFVEGLATQMDEVLKRGKRAIKGYHGCEAWSQCRQKARALPHGEPEVTCSRFRPSPGCATAHRPAGFAASGGQGSLACQRSHASEAV